MKRKKLILAIFIALFTTGCTVDCNLLIEDNKIKETTKFTQDETDEDDSYIYTQYLEEYPIYKNEEFLYNTPNEKIEGNTYYEKTIEKNNNGYNATYKAEYKLKNYNKSRMLDTAFSNYSIGWNKDKKCYYILANEIKIFNENNSINKLKISINLNDYEVVESNNDSVENGILIWNFDKTTEKSIDLQFKEKHDPKDTTKNDSNKNNNNNNDISKNTMLIFFAIVLLTLLMLYYICNRIKNSNKNNDI